MADERADDRAGAAPVGFGPIFRSSPVLDALGGFMSRGEGAALEVGLLVGPRHLNARGSLHGGVTATLLDVGMGYLLVARSGGKRYVTARLTIDYRASAQAGDWLQVQLGAVHTEGRKATAQGQVLANGERLVAEVSALFIDAAG